MPPLPLTSCANALTTLLNPGIWSDVPATTRQSGLPTSTSWATSADREERCVEWATEEGSSYRTRFGRRNESDEGATRRFDADNRRLPTEAGESKNHIVRQ